jgi:hypothetical protein
VSRATAVAFRPFQPAAGARFSSMARSATVGVLKLWLFDRYRPELHYMRGAGPKWREKYPPPNRSGAIDPAGKEGRVQ